ncbi:Nucleolar protein 58 [Orbilia oligospora]|uniref:Nucleolar protein 58 n=2 Tax=Orbilia oligospora TaxID=2813651 RepID=A0A7C8VCZ6_ORBOL|nr:Nucleolar protein 58 [Orbilia oligospora]
MSAATNFNFSVIVIPSAARPVAANLDFPTLNQSLSFALEVSSPSDFQTLYSQDSKGGNTFKGLLYVPDLDPSDPCDNHDLVPRNITRKANLPMDDLKLIAYAPLITQHCSRQYMYSAENDNVAAFIFYGVPAKYSNHTDPLQGEEYPFEYPVYFLDGAIGQPLMNKLSEYSANMSEVYNGFNLTEAGYDIRDYARIYTVISTRNTNPMPGLWLFLLVVVAVLLFIIGASSLLMHLFQFHYRRSLRRRIANGEVDLEGLGVGRITVPREFLAKFPLYVYIAENGGQSTPPKRKAQNSTAATRSAPKEEGRRKEKVRVPSAVVVKEGVSIMIPATITAERKSKGKERVKDKSKSPTAIDTTTSPEMAEVSTSKGLTLASPTTPSTKSRSSPRVQSPSTSSPQLGGAQTPTASSPPHHRGYHQTSCPICLDDFIHQETTVRELPCLHIFHPECIDPYLESQSSLCVLCKQSCLPKGYVPIRLTNAIVRRERLLRSVRERSREVAAATAANNGGNSNDEGGILWRWRLRRLRRQELDLMGRQALVRAGRGNYGERGRGGGFGLGPQYREQRVVEDVVRPRWRETMDRIFPGFR